MSVHYKFNAAKDYDTLPVDGLHISLADLKEAIIHHKRLGKGDVCDLKVTNAETKEVYMDEKQLIPKNSSLVIARVPIDPALKKLGNLSQEDKELLLANPDYRMNIEGAEEAERLSRRIEAMPDLTKFQGTEEEKISVMIAQSTMHYHPSKYLKLRNTNMQGKVDPKYKCHKCYEIGHHWVQNCPRDNQDMRKSSGIPSVLLVEVTDPNTPGVMINSQGKYVVMRTSLPSEGKTMLVRDEAPSEPPKELECPICESLMKSASMVPCCAVAYCDKCIRDLLLEMLLDLDETVCPACKCKDIKPDQLVPNRYLRLKCQQFGLPTYTVVSRSNSDSPISITKEIKSRTQSPIVLSGHNTPERNRNNTSPVPTRINLSPLINRFSTSATTKKPKRTESDKENLVIRDALDSVTHSENEAEEQEEKVKKRKKEKKKHHKEEKEKKHHKKNKKKEKKHKKHHHHSSDSSSSSEDDTEEKDKKHNTSSLMNEAICPAFDPSVPPPNVIAPPPYVQGSSVPVFPQSHYGHGNAYHPIPTLENNDPLATFTRYLEEKDKRKRRRPSKSPRTSSRSPSPRRFKKGMDVGRTEYPYSPQRTESNSRYTFPMTYGHQEYSSYNQYNEQNVMDPNFLAAENNYVQQSSYDNSRGRGFYRGGHQRRGYHDDAGRGFRPNHHHSQTHPGQDPRHISSSSRSHHKFDNRRIQDKRHDVRSRSSDRPDLHHYQEEEWDRRNKDTLKPHLRGDRSHSRGPHDKRHSGRASSPRDYDRRERERKGRTSPRDMASHISPREQESSHISSRESSRISPRERQDREMRKAYSGSNIKYEEERYRRSRSYKSNSRERVSSRTERPVKISKEREPKSKDQIRRRELESKELNKLKEPMDAKRIRVSKWDTRKEDDVSVKENMSSKDLEKNLKEEAEQKKIKKKKKDKKHEVHTEEEEKKKKKKEKKKLKKELLAAQQEQSSGLLSPVIVDPALRELLPQPSKWERDEDDLATLNPSPMKNKNLAQEDQSSIVTSDVLKRAENALFSGGRSLISSKRANNTNEKDSARSPTPEWDKMENREAKKKGASIQITINSKNESQIGRNKINKLPPGAVLDTNTEDKPRKRDLSVGFDSEPAKKSSKLDQADNSSLVLSNNLTNLGEASSKIPFTATPLGVIPIVDPSLKTALVYTAQVVGKSTSPEEQRVTSSEEVIDKKEIISSPVLLNAPQSTTTPSQDEASLIAKPLLSPLKDDIEEGEIREDLVKENLPDSTEDGKKIVTGSAAVSLTVSSVVSPKEDELNLNVLSNKEQSQNLQVPPPLFKRSVKVDKIKKKKKRKHSFSASSEESSSSSSSSDSSSEEEKKKKKKKSKKRKKKVTADSDSTDDEKKKKKKKKDKKKKKKKDKKVKRIF